MRRIRVLVVDDSASIRKLLADAIAATSDLEVCGSAHHGRAALDRLDLVEPDVVTLDLEMPVLDGLSTLRELRVRRPRLPVVMFSSHTERGALATLDALAAGATDFVAKPRLSGPGEALAFVQREVLPKLRTLGGGRAREDRPAPPPPLAGAQRPAAPRTGASAGAPAEAVVLAVSTGGPQALAAVLPGLPARLAAPVLVVQHMPPLFTRILADRLAALGPNPVAEATDGMPVEPGHVYLAPGGRHLTVEPAAFGAPPRLRLDDGPPENSCRPSADPLFRAAAEIWGKGLLAVVLTGMGRDGCAGAARVKERGGAVLAQDEATSVVWGMPGAVIGAGLAEHALPLAEVAGEIGRRVAARGGRP